MLALSELAGLAATVGADGRSGVADAVAAAWDLPPGAARFWRSSASHVFAVRDPVAAYLRFVPEAWRPRRRLEAVADLMRRLGAGVAPPLPSAAGRLVETVGTARGRVHAMLVRAAPGAPADPDGLAPARARAWGAALARLHRAADGADLPETLTLAGTGAVDAELAEAVMRLRAALDALPRDPRRFGVVHGDFELDNIAWQGETPTAYDFDDAGRSWFAADIAHALREVGPPTDASFLAGYRSVRELPDADLDPLPLFAAAHAAAWLLRLPAVLDVPPGPEHPPWLDPLRVKLESHAARQRALVLVHAHQAP